MLNRHKVNSSVVTGFVVEFPRTIPSIVKTGKSNSNNPNVKKLGNVINGLKEIYGSKT